MSSEVGSSPNSVLGRCSSKCIGVVIGLHSRWRDSIPAGYIGVRLDQLGDVPFHRGRSGVSRMRLPQHFKELDPIPQFEATAKLGEFLETRFSQAF